MWRENLPRLYTDMRTMPASIGIGFEYLCIKMGRGNGQEGPVDPFAFGSGSEKYMNLVNKTVNQVNNPFGR